jgi:hypothetical protein
LRIRIRKRINAEGRGDTEDTEKMGKGQRRQTGMSVPLAGLGKELRLRIIGHIPPARPGRVRLG